MRLVKHCFFLFFTLTTFTSAWSQCEPMEPGFRFLSSSRGCAPFNLQIQTSFFQSSSGTTYYVNWGDGSLEEVYVQATPGPDGPIISHVYPNAAQDCYFELTIEAENDCNPRGSVPLEPIFVTVWTNDVLAIDPGVYRVCQGFAANMEFTDNSDWNCFPLLVPSRENRAPRWIQWIYGTGNPLNQISNIEVDGISPGGFPYADPNPANNPLYPVLAPGETSLPIAIPVTAPGDVGKEFQITLRNWNQCNAYDNTLIPNPLNPVNLINGDNAPQVQTARVVIVESPQPDFLTRLGNINGPIKAIFCVGEDIFFHNQTPAITGAEFGYRWEFFDNPSGTGAPIETRTNRNPTYSYASGGQKLIRLYVRDTNAVGNCEAVVETVITISPSLVATIQVTDFNGNVITPDFCQASAAPLTDFEVRFNDVSTGTATAGTQWRWEIFNSANDLIHEFPLGGGYSTTPSPSIDRLFTAPGVYRAVLKILDNVTSCETTDEIDVRIFRQPQPEFLATRVCVGTSTMFTDQSSLTPIGTESIVSYEWDLDYDGVTFSKDPAYDNQTSFSHTYVTAGTHAVALQVTTDIGSCSSLIIHDVIVDALPIATFTPDVVSGCSDLEVTFTNTSISQPEVVKEFQWEVDGGSGFQLVATQDPLDPLFTNTFVYEFINNGVADKVFQARLKVITTNDCERVSLPVGITVNPSPSAGFVSLNYSPFNVNCSPVSVNFNVDPATQNFSPSEYVWTITDGATIVDQISTGTTPAFDYDFTSTSQAIKDFAITLEARLATGCFGDSTRTIRVSPVPVSTFDIDTVVYECERVILHLEADQKGLQEYAWSVISNGVTLFSSVLEGDQFEYEISRSLMLDQDIDITLTTTNFANCESAETTQSIFLPRTDVVTASFTASPLVQKFPASTITITNSSSPGPWEYLWEFGDGSTDTNSGASFNHIYETFGTFQIVLTVSNNDCVKTQAMAIEIQPPTPVLDFDYDPAFGCVPLTVNFTNQSIYADESSYEWDFGMNQGPSNAVNPTYTYYEPGIYTVTLKANNGFGEEAQISKQLIIEAYKKPNADFSVKPSEIQFPGGKLYTDNKSFGALNYVWDFGDGSTSTEFEPVHLYEIEGLFDVTLIAINGEGCSDTTRLESGVRTVKSGQVLIPNAFSPSVATVGDGIGKNDFFRPLLRGVVEFQMMIFNRWGQLLYETKDPNLGWDGYYQGKICPPDVYVYKISGRYSNGEALNKVGDVQLIR